MSTGVFEGITVKTMQFTVNKQNENRFNNIKVVKVYNRLQPYVLVKSSILNENDIPSWNTRQLVLFNFEDGLNLTGSGTGKVIAQYVTETITHPDFDFSQYSFFKIIKIKAIGSGEVFKNIQQAINEYDPNTGNIIGTQLENINITEQSFDNLLFDINYIQNSEYFMFGFKCEGTDKTSLYDTNESSSVEDILENMIYIYENNYTTGFSSIAVETTMKFVFLMKNTAEIEVINTTPISNYSILLNNSTSNVMNANTTDIITLYVLIQNGVIDSKINLRFVSTDILFNTFVPEFKTVGQTQYLVSSQPSGLNPELYVFNLSVFKIVAIDSITGSTTSVISLNGTRTIEIRMEPDIKNDYFGGSDPYPPLVVSITNPNPSIFDIPSQFVTFPTIDSNTGIITNSFFDITTTSNPDNLNVQFVVSFDITSADSIFANLSIPNIFIQIASITINASKCLINTASQPISYNPNIIISTAPGTLEEGTVATILAHDVQSAISPQIYNFNVKVIDGQYTIEYVEELQVEPIIRRFSAIEDIFVEAYEGDVYIFDTSDITNRYHFFGFFTSSTITGNNEITDIDYIVYNENINQGFPGSTVTFTIPPSSSYTNVYISDFPAGEGQQIRLNGLCRINILANPTNIDVGTFTFNQLVGNESITMNLAPNYDNNNIPIQAINTISFRVDEQSTTSTRIIELFSGEIQPLPQLIVNSIYLSKPENVSFVVTNKTDVTITWYLNGGTIYQFANPRETRFPISVYYNIYRSNIEATNVELIGTSILNTFKDTTAGNFNNYNYYIESVATWENMTISSERSDTLFVFVCENNRFPNGRWNNSITNPKLYKELTTCSNRNNITTNLYPNSWSLSRKQIYARLSNLAINKR